MINKHKILLQLLWYFQPWVCILLIMALGGSFLAAIEFVGFMFVVLYPLFLFMAKSALNIIDKLE